jgi:endonuclease/exonuclease/phosphatase family metal-dependent hydrolase
MASTCPVRHALRRLAPVALVALCACGPGPSASDEDLLGESHFPLPGDVRVRLMAANLTSGNGQSYDPGHGTRIFQGTDPDIVMIQEFNYGSNSNADIQTFVSTAFGPTFSWYREGGAQIPNGIVSRYPILASGEWNDSSVSNRDFAWARIDIPGPADLWAISAHLLTSGTSARNTEAKQLVQLINANVPAGDYLAIGGDFNTGSRSEACVGTFSQVAVTAGPYPADKNGNTNTNAGRSSPYDWVIVDSDLHALRTPVVIGTSSFTNGLVADTRVYSPIAQISPALAGDSGASGMQHMGVLRDFLIPGDPVVGTITVTSPNGGESWVAGSAQTITWTSSDVTDVRLESTIDGSTWSTIIASTPAAPGSYAWMVPATTTELARVRVSDVSDPLVNDIGDADFTIAAAAGPADVFLNEILANEPGSTTSGEFVEIVNAGGVAIDIGGWTIADSVSTRHTFPAGTTLGAGDALVVFGGAASLPPGLANAVAASTGTLGFSNGGDTVTLRDGALAAVDSYVYSSQLASVDGVSMNRSPDGSSGGSFVLHTTLSASSSSPGVQTDGSAF